MTQLSPDAPQYCPLYWTGHPETEIPEVCESTCSALWDKARRDNVTNGPYDTYTATMPDDSDCQHEQCDVENALDSIKKLGQFTREYTIVDAWTCGSDLGEQGYLFICPLSGQTDL